MTSLFERLPLPLPFAVLIQEIGSALPAFEKLQHHALTELLRIRMQPGVSCAEALDVFDKVNRDLAAIVGVVSHLESVCTADAIRATNEKLQELSASFSASVYSDPDLYRFFCSLKPVPSDARAMQGLLFGFESSGAKLNPELRSRMISIEEKLAELTNRFGQSIVDSTKLWSWHAADEAHLPGVLESDREAARDAACAAGKNDGYLFTLHAPSYRAISSFHQERAVREKFARAYGQRANAAPFDNSPRVSEILKLRAEKATLLEYESFLDFSVADRMAGNAATVGAFFESIRAPVLASARRDIETLTAFAQQNGHPQDAALEAWDVPYYLQLFSEKVLGLDPQVIREYFPFEASLEAIFGLIESVFGVSFPPINLPTWCEGVQSFLAAQALSETQALSDTQALSARDLPKQSFPARSASREFGVLYTDYYARENKRAGAWMDMLAPALTGQQKGIGFMAGNFSKPTPGKPALLTHGEITTLFHEAGHLLHGLVCETPRAMQGMQEVAWDFIEVPSQILENWAWEPTVLRRITKHYKTGAPMPEDLIAKLVASRSVMNGIFYARHLGNSALDFELHTNYREDRDGDPVTWSRNFLKRYVSYTLEDSAIVNSFTHLFGEPMGYAGGYYSYLWSEALEVDMFTAFAGENVLSREIGEKFVREVLMPGDTVPASKLFRNFMGRDPSPAALLKRINGE